MKRFLMILALLAAPAWAVQPDEILDDPVLEERARALSKDLRCLVCQNESIDDSNAELARDLRILVRDRLVKGDSDEEAMEFIVSRYGEFVLLKPRMGGTNIVLYLAGPVMLVLALGAAGLYLRRRQSAPKAVEAGLDADEEARLKEILGE
jgi:cytochrome c-type biogenesis protein CcmH